MEDEDSDEGPVTPAKRPAAGAKRQSGRGRAKVSYAEAGGDDEDTEMS